MADGRSTAEIRKEIAGERAQLGGAVDDLRAEVKRTGQLASAGTAALSGLMALRRMRKRRQR